MKADRDRDGKDALDLERLSANVLASSRLEEAGGGGGVFAVVERPSWNARHGTDTRLERRLAVECSRVEADIDECDCRPCRSKCSFWADAPRKSYSL